MFSHQPTASAAALAAPLPIRPAPTRPARPRCAPDRRPRLAGRRRHPRHRRRLPRRRALAPSSPSPCAPCPRSAGAPSRSSVRPVRQPGRHRRQRRRTRRLGARQTTGIGFIDGFETRRVASSPTRWPRPWPPWRSSARWRARPHRPSGWPGHARSSWPGRRGRPAHFGARHGADGRPQARRRPRDATADDSHGMDGHGPRRPRRGRGRPMPFDGTLPVDLGGVPGVSAEEQAQAEDLVTPLEDLPQFADPATLPDQGWSPSTTPCTGFEHYINWPLIDDDEILDPDTPESIVLPVGRAAGREAGGRHVHGQRAATRSTTAQLRRQAGPVARPRQPLLHGGEPRTSWVVGGVSPRRPAVPPGHVPVRRSVTPMVHVWITPHPCGPFVRSRASPAARSRRARSASATTPTAHPASTAWR